MSLCETWEGVLLCQKPKSEYPLSNESGWLREYDRVYGILSFGVFLQPGIFDMCVQGCGRTMPGLCRSLQKEKERES